MILRLERSACAGVTGSREILSAAYFDRIDNCLATIAVAMIMRTVSHSAFATSSKPFQPMLRAIGSERPRARPSRDQAASAVKSSTHSGILEQTEVLEDARA